MATARYDVTYDDGRERVKRLNAEDAKTLDGTKGIKSVTKQRGSSQNKGRAKAEDK